MTILTERINPGATNPGGDMLHSITAETAEVATDPYHLDDPQLNAIESDVVARVCDLGYGDRVVTVLVRGDDEHASFGRTYEQRTFDAAGEDYDFAKNYGKYETHSLFLYTVDPEAGAIAHVKRLVMAKTLDEMEDTGLTGIEMLDDRMNAKNPDEHAEIDDILAVHDTNIELIAGRTINVATNLTTMRAPLSIAKPYSLVSYKGVFNVAKTAGAEQVFVYQNRQAIKSLGKMGVTSELLGDREYHLPLPNADPEIMEDYDQSYIALVLPGSSENHAAFANTESRNPMVAAVGRMAVPVLAL